MTTLQHVELGVLGPLQVRQHGLPVAVPGAKPRAVLTMLGLHGGSVVSADTLAELLWGARPPRTAVKALQTHISALRRALGDGFVLTEGTGWTLSTTDIDATRYKVAARLGRDAIAAGDASQAVARFDEALSLWRGIPELPDGPRAASEKTRWIEGHAALVEDRADALLATGRAAEIVGELEAAIADAPLRERRWGQLMLALYRAGRQGEALAAYQRARSLLADELGVDPGPNLRRLEAAIVSQDAALEIPVSQQLSTVTKAVTFLLTDIEGSTAAWEAQADAMAVALARHDEIVEQVVTSRGGRLVKTRGEGDATFSVFDRPSAAAAAAIALQEAIRHEPWVLANPMRIRVALHTGEVELRDGDYFGRAVNRAARLRSLADGGQILCSGATAELVIDSLSDDVLLADLGMRKLKNLARPEHVFELRLEAADDSPAQPTEAPIQRPALPAVLTGPGPFVGRGTELAGLLAAWQSTLAAGARAVLVAGEPGVGKTRLAGEWSRQAYEEGAVVLYGRCDEDLGAAYQPFAEALRSLVPCLGANRLRGLRGVEPLLALVPGLIEVVPDLPTPSRSDPDTERYALFDAVVALLAAASTSAPVVLILDDLHWAAKPTLLLLRHLLRFGEHARVQIVGTYRNTDLDRSHPLAAMLADLHRDGTATRLSLSGLDEDDVTAYVAEAGYDDEELARALASVTGGNPFFLIEALRHVDESGGRWDPSTLPQGVREAVSRRLSRLPVETNKALAAAAVVGSRFPLALVESVVGDDLIDAFDEASKAGIVIEEPGGRYRFNHAIVRQSLLAELASVRRMRLHQKIAVTLETESAADDELLAELAYHYFECAWAGNAAKAVEYCRRAADQAIERLAYEGAADLYDRALHALEELDEELPDRDAQQAELLVARCEALLAAGDVVSAAGAVSQLQRAAGDSVRLTAWGTCFDGQLSMLTNPERLDEIESAVGAAAQQLAGLEDAAGEANAHTVRAACLARLGRIGDAETALDQALTAARRAHEHRRVNAVLAGAPLAALWGPNPVPRAGGRCLDVVRLLRITTGSPVVEATSTRCQGVLDALRGRAAAGRALIDSARRSLTELGMRHALLEVEQFAGIVELVANDPAAAETHLRRAYSGFRRMGLDADTAETAALLARACIAQDRDAEADQLCTESERLAGHALKASIAWRAARAQLLARGGAHDEARRVAEEAVAVAERTDLLVDHGDACLTLAIVSGAAGDSAGARAAAGQAVELYERKGAAALAEIARGVLGAKASAAPVVEEGPSSEPDNLCVRVLRRAEDAVNREAWSEVEQVHAPIGSIESRRKIVGFERIDLPPSKMASGAANFIRDMRIGRSRRPILAIRGERLALTRTEVGTADDTPGAPRDEMLQLVGLDDEGRIALQIWFDLEDMDAAVAELDAQHAGSELDTACVRLIHQIDAAYDRDAWEEVGQCIGAIVSVESRRKIVGVGRLDHSHSEWLDAAKHYRQTLAEVRYQHTVVAVRGERLALTSLEVGPTDQSPGAPRDALLQLYGLDEAGRLALHVHFDIDDLDAAMAELDAQHARLEEERPPKPLENECVRVGSRVLAAANRELWDEFEGLYAAEVTVESHRKLVGFSQSDLASTQWPRVNRLVLEASAVRGSQEVVAVRGERLALARVTLRSADESSGAPYDDYLQLYGINHEGRIALQVVFDADGLDAALDELDVRYLAGEAAPHAHAWSVVVGIFAALARHEMPTATVDWVNIDHRRGTPLAHNDLKAIVTTLNELTPNLSNYVESVHLLHDCGALFTQVSRGTSPEGFDAEWRILNLLTVDGDKVSRCELFDEADIDAAIKKFEELSRPAPQLDNAANRVLEKYLSHFPTRDWDAMAPALADDFSADDRRRVVNSGVRHGRDNEIANIKAMAEIGCSNITTAPVAIRGERLVLARHSFVAPEWPDTGIETIDVVEINADNQIVAEIIYDADDLDAAIEELDARYLAGEAAPYARTWSVAVGDFAALNRHEIPAVTSDYVIIDHQLQHATVEASGLAEHLQATWDLTPNLRMHIESVHRLTDVGVVITLAVRGTSNEGFDADWRIIELLTREGELGKRCEVFNEADLDAALTRFDELNRPVLRLENAATRVVERFNAFFAARDWDGVAGILSDDVCDDDRRRVVNSGVQRGRDAQIANLRAIVDLGMGNYAPIVVATRGDRLALTRTQIASADQSDMSALEPLSVAEINSDGQLSATVHFDDFEDAIAEIDTRYVASEAAPYAHTWSVVTKAYTLMNDRGLPATTPDWVNVDHRRGATFAPGDMTAYIEAAWADLEQNLRIHVEAVHRLSNTGTVVTQVLKGTTREGFDAEWRTVNLFVTEGELFSRCELFDEADLDAALARFDELSRSAPKLTNVASKAHERLMTHLAAHDWDAMTSTMTDDIVVDDRRHVVNAGIRHGREAAIADSRAIADLGVMTTTSTAIATRGEHLILTRFHAFGSDPESFQIDILHLVQIVRDDQIAAIVMFDIDDIDAAFEELDKRYLAGEAAAHADAWSVIASGYTAFNRREPAASAADWVVVDHRRGTGFASGEMTAIVRAEWDLTPDISYRVEAVHRISNLGAVVTHTAHGTSQQDFQAEWRVINLLTVDGDRIDRNELFDEADLDAAMVRFDELSRPRPTLENAASQVNNRFDACFAARDWAAMAELVAEDMCNDDRRRVIGAGIRYGRDAEIANMRAVVDVGVRYATSLVVATRGQHLALLRTRFSGRNQSPEAFHTEIVEIVEINADNQITHRVAFDADDIDSALTELEARYVAGEAGPHAQAWSAVIQTTTAFGRREIPAGTSGSVSIDHRRGTAFAPGELTAYIRSTWHLSQQTTLYVEAVHRLSSSGAVITYAAHATSRGGFSAEWRVVNLFMFEGALVDRCEIFDEADLDAATAKFDDLNSSTPQIQNAASLMMTRFQQVLRARDWDGMAEIFADDICLYDRRPVVGVDFVGRDATIANMRASADTGVKNVTSTAIATRGSRLTLHRVLINGRDNRPEAFRTEALVIGEVDGRNRTIAFVMFDLDDIDAAFEELDARYLAVEAAAHAHAWSVIAEGYATLNRHELPPTPPDFVSIDRRRGGGAFAAGELLAFISASWDDMPDNKIRVEVVHRLNDIGAVVSSATQGSSVKGFAAEWRQIDVVTVGDDMINRTELYDEADLDAALARFDELCRPAPRLENTAGLVERHVQAHIAARNWHAVAALLADDICLDDRRRVVNAGLRRGRDVVIDDLRIGAEIGLTEIAPTGIAIRGESLTLGNTRYGGRGLGSEASFIEIVQLVEIDADERIKTIVLFDPDDLDAAYAELDSRYLAGEAAAHARTWSVILGGYAASNRRELPPTTPDWQTVDHRRAIAFAPGDLARYMHATWEVAPDSRAYAAAVHRLSQFGAVVTQTVKGASPSGFYAEWQEIVVLTVEGDLLNRAELYDEPDLNAALARFEEVSRPAQRLENAATRVFERVLADFRARDWDAMAANLSAEYFQHDRRRVVNAGIRRGRDAEIESFRSAADLGITHFSPSVVATRGERVGLVRARAWGRDHEPGAFIAENLFVVEITAENQAAAALVFDLDNLDAAFAELDARYLAGEAAAHARTYSVIAGAFAAVNRRELPSTTSDLVSIDHRHPIAFAPGELIPYLRATLNDAPDIRIDINAVHRLSSVGAVVTHAWHNTSQQGFDAEWRVVGVSTVDGDLINRCELFDDSDLDAALARFDELCPLVPRVENAATRTYERFRTHFLARDWDALAEVLADDHCGDDRRRVVNSGIRLGRDAEIASMQATADVGVTSLTSNTIAIRGERLALCRTRGGTGGPEAFDAELLRIVEIDADRRVAARVVFDLDDFDAAIEELDARYLAGEAAPHAHTWSVVAKAYAAMNRRELPATTRDWVAIDRRRLPVIEESSRDAYLSAALDVSQSSVYMEAVLRISDVGAVVTWEGRWTTPEGFDGEWRGVSVLTREGDLINRVEMFDEVDIDTALARFDELSVPAPRLENAASRVCARYRASFATRDWDAVAAMLADQLHNEDRRRVVNAGIRRGRESALKDLRASTDLGVPYFTATEIANRGERLVLFRGGAPYGERPGAFHVDVLQLAEIDADERISTLVTFDVDDIDAALAELDARYLAGEAAAYAHTWSLIARNYAAFNGHEFPSAAPDWITIDHRRGTSAGPGDLTAYIRSTWDVTPEMSVLIETVHRASALGAVLTQVSKGTSHQGFEAEWREICLLMADGQLFSRCELFDEADLDAALARFDELNTAAPQLKNAATRGSAPLVDVMNRRDVDGFLAAFDVDAQYDDRRKGLQNAGPIDRKFAHAMFASESTMNWQLDVEPIAVRGRFLALVRHLYRDTAEADRPITVEALALTEATVDELLHRFVIFDPDDIDGAFEELDSRYLAGEGAGHARTWSVVTAGFAALSRREVPARTPDWAMVDHRKVTTFGPGDLSADLLAMWDLAPNASYHIETVHRLNDFGAVVTYTASATTPDGFVAEWRALDLMTVSGDMFSHTELFDESELDAALARFDELTQSTSQLENAATRGRAGMNDAFNRRDLDAFLAFYMADGRFEDRRKGLRNEGVVDRDFAHALFFEAPASWRLDFEIVAIRGDRLALTRERFRDGNEPHQPIVVEMLTVMEVADDELVQHVLFFDADDIGAAMAELTARWIARGEVAHPQVIEAGCRSGEAYNRHAWDVVAAMESGATYVNHRQLVGAEPETIEDHWRSIRTLASLIPDIRTEQAEVIAYSGNGLLSHVVVKGTTAQGAAIELPAITLILFDGARVTRLEAFDIDQRDLAVARFQELNR